MKRTKKSTSLMTPAIDDVPADRLRKVIGGNAQSPASANPSGPTTAVIIITAVA